MRQLAEDIVQEIFQGDDSAAGKPEDLITALVRQWVTYDGNATLFADEQELYLRLGKTPLGKPLVTSEPGSPTWVKQLIREWKIRPEQWPDIREQLNLGQSTEATNDEGIPLRLWVNPRERGKGVEPLVARPGAPPAPRDFRERLATQILEQEFRGGLDEDELEALACSVARQWREYQGNACLFLDREQLMLTLAEQGKGKGRVERRRVSANLEPLLSSLGFATETVPETIAKINLGLEIEFRDREGRLSRLRYDPKTRRIVVTKPGPAPRGNPPSFICTKCSGVLWPWREGQRQQRCPQCGQTIARS